MSDRPTDVDLLRAIGAGDVRAVGLLYGRYAPTLLPLAIRIVRDRSEAEDVIHDAFVAVADRAGQYSEERGSVVAWLVTHGVRIEEVRRDRASFEDVFLELVTSDTPSGDGNDPGRTEGRR